MQRAEEQVLLFLYERKGQEVWLSSIIKHMIMLEKRDRTNVNEASIKVFTIRTLGRLCDKRLVRKKCYVRVRNVYYSITTAGIKAIEKVAQSIAGKRAKGLLYELGETWLRLGLKEEFSQRPVFEIFKVQQDILSDLWTRKARLSLENDLREALISLLAPVFRGEKPPVEIVGQKIIVEFKFSSKEITKFVEERRKAREESLARPPKYKRPQKPTMLSTQEESSPIPSKE